MSDMMKKLKKGKGFTLVELLAVVVILGIVISIVAVNIAKKMKDTKNQAFITSYEIILDSVQKSINSKNLNLSDESDVICFNTDECSKIHYISKDNYLMAVVKTNDDSYTLAVTGKGDFENVSLGTVKNSKMVCSGNYCVSEIKDGTISMPDKPEHVYAIKYHYYNNEITKDNGILYNVKKIIAESLKEVATEIKASFEKEKDIEKIFSDPYKLEKVINILNPKLSDYNENVLSKEENNMKIEVEEWLEDGIVFKITINDEYLGYENYYSFHEKNMKNICMPKDFDDNSKEYSYYVLFNFKGDLEDSSFLAEAGYCNLPG